MEQHPVPQNVTTFQFRLIGDMTIKQFAYLAIGAIGGYIFYKLPLPFFFDWPLAVLSVVLGIGLAFVPIEERPMDVWLLSFIKSVYSPTQFVWAREARRQEVAKPTVAPAVTPIAPVVNVAPMQPPVSPPPAPTQFTPVIPPSPVAATVVKHPQPSIAQTLEHLFQPVEKAPKGAHAIPPTFHPETPKTTGGPTAILSQHKAWSPFDVIRDFFTFRPKAVAQPAYHPQIPSSPTATPAAGPASQYPDIFANMGPMPSLTGKKLDLSQASAPVPTVPTANEQAAIAREIAAEQKEKELNARLVQMQEELTTKTTTDARILELQKQLTDVLSERGKMEQELKSLRTQVHEASTVPQVMRQAGVVTAPQTAQPTVRVITPETAVRAGLPRLTTFPNVVTGIIKDAEGNLLPGVLVTVRDKDEVPVRALKTNKLGQFAASTPLPNGTYTVDIEDPRNQHFFDRVRVTLNGTVMSPVEVTSKSKKEMDRNKLAAEIFGTKEL